MDDKNIENSKLNVSLIDIKGEVNDGVVLLLNLMISDESYEIGYWFNKNNDIIISPEEKLLNHLGIEKIEDYVYFNDFLFFIHESIPHKEEILKEYIK